MKNKIIIRSVDEYYDMLTNYSQVNNFAGKNITYNIAQQFGSGYIERLVFNSGVEVCFHDITFKQNIKMQHVMDLCEICYCTVGHISYIDSECGNISLSKGQYGIYMIENSEGVTELYANKPVASISIGINKSFIKSVISPFSAHELTPFTMKDKKYQHQLMIPRKIDSSMKSLFSQIYNCPFTGVSRIIYIESKAMEIISYVIGNNTIGLEPCEIQLTIDDVRKLEQASAILVNNLDSPPSIEELSRAVSLNSWKLKKGFRKQYGTTVYGHLKEIRLKLAKKLLLERTDMNINEIVYEVGYSNPGHFARAFKERYGSNPKKFRMGGRYSYFE